MHSGDIRLSQYEPAYPKVFSEKSENQQLDYIVEAEEPVASSISAKPPLGESVLKPVPVSVSPIAVKKHLCLSHPLLRKLKVEIKELVY